MDLTLALSTVVSVKNSSSLLRSIKPLFIFNRTDSFRGEDYHAKQTAIYHVNIESVII